MDVFDAVRTILAVRQYGPRPVPAAVIRKVVQAGHLSASSMNKQPWHFIVVQERESLARLGGLARSGPYTAGAAFAIVIAIEKESPFGVSDASRAAQSMMLTAWGEGLGSNWVGFRGLEAVGEALSVPPEFVVLAIIPFGYPDQAIGRGKKTRKPLAEIASRERYGQPFD